MPKRSKKTIRRTAIIFFSLMTVVAIAFALVGNYFYEIAISSKIDKSNLFSSQEENILVDTSPEEVYSTKSVKWVTDGARDAYITSEDNLKLHGYEIENSNQKNLWAIILHGYGGEGLKMCGEAKRFYDMGFSVLMPDLRGCGESQGDAIGMGWLDRKDMLKWIDYIINKSSESQILMYGVSMGGATVMMTTGEELPSNVKVAIEDCGYTSVNDELEIQLEALFGLPPFPVIYAASSVTFFRAGYTFGQASSVEQVKKSITPTLFIHGDQDEFVPFHMLDTVYEAAACEKEKLVVEGAGHVGSSGKNPELYWNTIEKFIGKYIMQ